MTFSIPAFRTAFPEFADTAVYPTAMIAFWSNVASMQVSQSIWQNQWNTGVSLYVAHEITMAAQNSQAAQTSGTPGLSGGVANTKTVGAATVGYDANTTTEKDAGWWNMTTYGRQYIHLARLFGMKCVQL